jgi:hypothetical protein
MRQTGFSIITIRFTATACNVNAFINDTDDFTYAYFTRGTRQPIATSRSANTFDQAALAQFGKQLLKIRQ